jgi:hypothetical protein
MCEWINNIDVDNFITFYNNDKMISTECTFTFSYMQYEQVLWLWKTDLGILTDLHAISPL